jgi:hypothetical protein
VPSGRKVSVTEALGFFGWNITHDFEIRYYEDSLVYNLVNALRVALARVQELETDEERRQREALWQIVRTSYQGLPEQFELLSSLPPRPWESVRPNPRYL